MKPSEKTDLLTFNGKQYEYSYRRDGEQLRVCIEGVSKSGERNNKINDDAAQAREIATRYLYDPDKESARFISDGGN